MEGSGESDTSMANVMVALPTYNPDVHSWFQQVETIFLMLRITSQRIKVANLMQKLPPDVISRITDALAELPEKKPYDYLKDIILKRTGRSEEERIRDVLQNITIGDRTPAQLLRFMKSQLGSKHVSETVLRTLWMERLPSWVSNNCSDVPIYRRFGVRALQHHLCTGINIDGVTDSKRAAGHEENDGKPSEAAP